MNILSQETRLSFVDDNNTNDMFRMVSWNLNLQLKQRKTCLNMKMSF